MSLITDLKTFASKVETEFVKLFKGKLPTILSVATGVVTFAAPLIEGLEADLAPAAESETAAIINTVKTDLATLSAAAKSANGATTAAQVVTNLQSSVPALLNVVKVENPGLVSKVEGVVNLIAPELAALATALI